MRVKKHPHLPKHANKSIRLYELMVIGLMQILDIDGFELCLYVRVNPEYDNVIIIIYTSSYKSPVGIEFGCAKGVNEYIIKPKEPSVFTQLIEKAILEHKK